MSCRSTRSTLTRPRSGPRTANCSDGIALIERDLATQNERELFRGARWVDGQGIAAEVKASPDGRKVYYRKVLPGDSKPPFREVAFMERDVATGGEREIVRGTLGGINVSPDGRYIATGSNDLATKTRSVVTISVLDGTKREALRVPLSAEQLISMRDSGNPAGVTLWAADSRSLLVTKRFGRDKPAELWWIPTGRSSPKRVIAEWMGRSIRVHPDGQRLVFDVAHTSARKPHEIWVLENVTK